MNPGVWSSTGIDFNQLSAGQMAGIVTDPNGAVIVGATIRVTNTQTGTSLSTTRDADGHWIVSGASPGATKIDIDAAGFKKFQQELQVAADRPTRLGATLDIGAVTETVTVRENTMTVDGLNRIDERARRHQEQLMNTPSQNVINLQRRVAGLLPVRVEVPRSGKSYRFVRPLVLDEQTRVTFQYKTLK